MNDYVNKQRDLERAAQLFESGTVLYRKVKNGAAGGEVGEEVFNTVHDTAGTIVAPIKADATGESSTFVFDSLESTDLPGALRERFGSAVTTGDGTVPYTDDWIPVGDDPHIHGLVVAPVLSDTTMSNNCGGLICAGTFVAASRFQWTGDAELGWRMLSLSACGFVVAVILDTTLRKGSFMSREFLRAFAWAAVSIALTVVLVAAAQHVMMLFFGGSYVT
jgi:hypothetical protein